jgi:hypothetical protein
MSENENVPMLPEDASHMFVADNFIFSIWELGIGAMIELHALRRAVVDRILQHQVIINVQFCASHLRTTHACSF